MPRAQLLKVIVQPVMLLTDEDGTIVGENYGPQTAIYSREKVIEFLDIIEQQIQIENSANDRESVSISLDPEA